VNSVGSGLQSRTFNSLHKKKNRRQHQADKGGLSIIVSLPSVRSNSFAPSRKLHNYAITYTFTALKASHKGKHEF
jgi:hypothetical protein